MAGAEGPPCPLMIRTTPRQSSARFGGRGVRELQTKLEIILDHVLRSGRSLLEPSKTLATYNLVEQERFLRTVERISDTSVELAYQFCHYGTPALKLLDEIQWGPWVDGLLQTFGKSGVAAAVTSMQEVGKYAASLAQAPQEVSFEEISRTLETLATGWGGRPLKLAVGDITHTDTETLFLPARLHAFPTKEKNFALYKVICAHLWAQTFYGTWRQDLQPVIQRYANPQRERATRLLHILETLRLHACLERDLPGLARVVHELCPIVDIPANATWQQAAQRLREPSAGLADSLQCLDAVWATDTEPTVSMYQGTLRPDQAADSRASRVPRERETLRRLLAQLIRDHNPRPGETPSVRATRIPDPDKPLSLRFDLRIDEQPVALPHDIQDLLESISQDFGDIPEEYLQAASDSAHDPRTTGENRGSQSGGHDQDVFLYDEWDHARRRYRKEWCQLREQDVNGVHDDFVRNVLHRHRGLLKHLRRSFEALRESDKRLYRQPYGDEIDLDAAISSYAEVHAGREGDDRLFSATRKADRNIAVMFMVDMSGSTSGWINEVERESLVLLCECLEVLGDRYGIYGFSGHTRTRCEIYRIKQMSESYGSEVRARIAGISPHGYTRMGVAIRHLTQRLRAIEARTKLLITLSDGRPDDQDGYRGQYGIEDTRRALMEAKFHGVHPYCITIDDRAREYLPHMYGPVNFTLVDRVEKLPFNVSDIYRRLTR